MQHFGSIENVLSATAQELVTVEGIGIKKAEDIRWLICADKNEQSPK